MNFVTAFFCLASFALASAVGENEFAGSIASDHIHKIVESVKVENHRSLKKRSISEFGVGRTSDLLKMLQGSLKLKHLVKREIEQEGESQEQDVERFFGIANEEQEFNEPEGTDTVEVTHFTIDHEICQYNQIADCIVSILQLSSNFNGEDICPNLRSATECATELVENCLGGDKKVQTKDFLNKFQNTVNEICPAVQPTTPEPTTVEDASFEESDDISIDSALCLLKLDIEAKTRKCQLQVVDQLRENIHLLRTESDGFCFGYVGVTRCAISEVRSVCGRGTAKMLHTRLVAEMDKYSAQTNSDICRKFRSEY